nr:hypothetical protein [Geobacter sp.]
MAEKGEAARTHIGLTVQRAMEVMTEYGLEPLHYGFICHDSWPDEVVEHPAEYAEVYVEPVVDEAGNEITPGYSVRGEMVKGAWTEVVRPAGDCYGFRSDELLFFLLRGLASAVLK